MWAEILCENRAAVVAPLRDTIDELREMLALLESGDHENVRRWLAAAKSRRDALSSNL
jgi:prephenate dehydrogenase